MDCYINQTIPLLQSFKFMKKRQTSPNCNPSKVLLVCVYDTVVLELNNQIIYARFAPFGSIIKILIFERGEVTKFFIEFACLSEAEKARTALDGAKLYEKICKMSIYYSNFRSVDLKHQNTEGVSLQPILQVQMDPYFGTYQSQFAPYPMLQQNNCYQVSYCQFLPTASSNLDKHFDEFNHQSPVKNTLLDENLKDTLQNSIQSKIQNEIDWLLRSGQKKQGLKQVQVLTGTNLFKLKVQSCYICFELTSQLLIRNVYNLFSNFGNISFIKKTKKQIFLKFRNYQDAVNAKDCLEGYNIKNNPLNIYIMKQNSTALPTEDQYAEITYYDYTFDRLTRNRSFVPPLPSQTLYVSQLQRGVCKTGQLKYIFEQFGPIEGVELIGQKQSKKAVLIRFKCVQDSIDALSELHGASLFGKKISIFFCNLPLN